MYVPLPVLPAVILMDTTGTNQAEVSPCNEIASLVVELRLRDPWMPCDEQTSALRMPSIAWHGNEDCLSGTRGEWVAPLG